jgi:hypothetical protein
VRQLQEPRIIPQFSSTDNDGRLNTERFGRLGTQKVSKLPGSSIEKSFTAIGAGSSEAQ